MHILIVDDSSMVRTMLTLSLKKWDYQATSVDNIDTATEVILRDSIQFVITDWVMPGGDGPTLCRRIRELNLPFYIYIILVTSLEGSQSLVDGMEAGADDFIHKPIQMEELLARIQAGERVLRLERSLHERNVKLEELSNNLLAAHEIINADLQVAERIQRKLLPTRASSILGVSIEGLFCPSGHVSGDIYNFFRLDEHHIGFYTIDVAGHGVAAAMMSLTLSQLLTPEIKPGNPLKYSLPDSPYYGLALPSFSVVDRLNQQFQTDATNTLYFTMIYGVIDTKACKIDLCQAGHPNPIYLPKVGAAQFIGDGGFPVGITLLAEYESIDLNYHAEDRLFFYSDGITECMNNQDEMFGAERLLMFVEETRILPIGEVLSALEERIGEWRGSKNFDDDISMLAMVMIDNRPTDSIQTLVNAL
jgi:sigma-B regulation protein RsbU (phosphoserine phosphatase)